MEIPLNIDLLYRYIVLINLTKSQLMVFMIFDLNEISHADYATIKLQINQSEIPKILILESQIVCIHLFTVN